MFYDWKEVEQEHVALLLSAIKRLYTDPMKWILWPRAEDENGREVAPKAIQATRWSLLGAGEMYSEALFADTIADYVECAMRDYLDDLSDGKAIHGMSYEDEYALICLAHETLTEKEAVQ